MVKVMRKVFSRPLIALSLGTLAATAVVSVAATSAFAGDPGSKVFYHNGKQVIHPIAKPSTLIDRTQAAQREAIEQGRYSGQLTRREYRGLLNEQQKIEDLERRAKADGHISRREFEEIRKAQAAAGAHIKDDASNGKVSLWRKWLYRSRY
jgi:Spy/CpxP family protein refolding chaperone